MSQEYVVKKQEVDRGFRNQRLKTNQPMGVPFSLRKKISHHYCQRHNYTYYPEGWFYNGIQYCAGYYDENGMYYNDLVLSKSAAEFHNVTCKCSYCNTTAKANFTNHTPLECPNCGGQMDVVSFLDVYTQDPSITQEEDNALPTVGKIYLFLFLGLVAFVGCIMAFQIVIDLITHIIDKQFEEDDSYLNSTSYQLDSKTIDTFGE